MLNVHLTVDTEIWCGSWSDLDTRFPDAFRTYVYGPTARGDYALPATLAILAEFGLPAVFFVEPLFSARFGLAPLEEIVGLVAERDQHVQLHLHPEWVDEAKDAILAGVGEKIPLLTLCDLAQQEALIGYGLERLREAGAASITTFRAGSYAANLDTLRALSRHGIAIDSSYNAASAVGVADIAPGQVLTQPCVLEGVREIPVSVFRSRLGGGLRPLQITACSYGEMTRCLNAAADAGHESAVIVSHNFELLSPDKSRADDIVVRRFRRLCRFLDDNRDRFNVCALDAPAAARAREQPPPFEMPLLPNAWRLAEQAVRSVRYA